LRLGGHMKTLLTVALGVAGSALCMAPALAAPPQPVDSTPIVVDFCGFDTSIVISGKQKEIAKGDGLFYLIAPGQRATVTNTETGESVTVNIAGSFRDQVQENGDIQSVLRGRNLIFGPGVEGLLLTIGRATATFTEPTEQEPFGTATITSGPQGRLVNLCDQLAE
jgi:hypothetical protein